MPYDIQLPDGTLIENIPDSVSKEEARQRISMAFPQFARPESGFVPAIKSGLSGVKEAGYAVLGRTGLMDEEEAQKAIEREQRYQQVTFRPTEEGWTEAPLTKVVELAGQSIPYMAAPLVAAGATLALPVTGTAATVAGLGAAGVASAAQFTGTNLLRQMETGKSIGETDLGNAALAAVPQAALDTLSLRMIPFVRGVFGKAGRELSDEAARRIASKSIKDISADYALATGKTMTVEGLTEAAQQSLERLQAGLSITDQSARDEYLDSFIGGAVLGGVLAPPGRYLERRSIQKELEQKAKTPPAGQPAAQPTQPGLVPGTTPTGAAMVEEEPDLTPEQEQELQARIAAVPPRAAPVVAPPPQPVSTAVAPVEEEVVQETVQETVQEPPPEAVPQINVLNRELARINAVRMDPTLSPDDPIFQELDNREAQVRAQISALMEPTASVKQPEQIAPVVPRVDLAPPPAAPPPRIEEPSVQLPTEEEIEAATEEVDEKSVQAELNRARQELNRAKASGAPDLEAPQAKVAELEGKVSRAKDAARGVQFRDRDNNTWVGRGKMPTWLKTKVSAGADIEDFRVRPEVGNRSDDELAAIESEFPPGYGRPAPEFIPEEYTKKVAEIERERAAQPNLFGKLMGKLSREEVIDISDERRMLPLRAGKGKGKDLSDIVNDGGLDEFLPFDLRSNAPTFDLKEATEYLKDQLRADERTSPEQRMSYEFREMLLPLLQKEIADLEAEMEPVDANRILQEIYAEERANIEDFESRAIEAEERGVGVPEDVSAKQKPSAEIRPPRESLFAEEEAGSDIEKIKDNLTRFASGMSSLSDLDMGGYTRAGYRRNGIGVDVGLLSDKAVESLANIILNLRTPVFIDSGAFSAFTQQIRGKGDAKVDFDKVLDKYDKILSRIGKLNETEEVDYPRPYMVMPDVVGDQAASVELIEQYKNWIKPEIQFNLSEPIIPIQSGELNLSQVYNRIVDILGTNEFIVGIPSQEKAISRQELADFLKESKPPRVHFLGAASDTKLNPLLAIVAQHSPQTKVSADASKIRSSILTGVSQGKTRQEAIRDALREEQDPAELIEKYMEQQSDVLVGQTPEELAELQRKEETGEAEAERDRVEAERAAKAAAEAQRIIADQKRETFELTPPPSAPAVQAAAPTGDLFGAAGITEQPTRKPRQVGAEPSPIEAAIEEEAKKDLTPEEQARRFFRELLPQAGFEKLKDDSPFKYVDQGGTRFPTYRRGSVSLAVVDNTQLYANDRGVNIFMGQPQDVMVAGLIVDQEARGQGEARRAMSDLTKAADATGITLFLEPAAIPSVSGKLKNLKTPQAVKAMTTPQLKKFYKQFGFEPQTGEVSTDRVMIRKPQTQKIDQEAVKNTIDAYVGDIRKTTSNFAPTVYDEANNTLTYVETWKTDEKIPREDFDELVAGASKTDTAKGAKYSILVKDTPTESLVLTFQPRGLTPTQKFVDVVMQMEETTVQTPERTYKEEVEFRTKEKKLDDPNISKKIQEARGVSKPVADAYVRAMKDQVVALANWTYGKGTEDQFSAAVKEVRKIESRIEGIEQRTKVKKGKSPTETVTPSQDTYIGINANGEKLYQRLDGSRYRMRMDRADRPNGYPDFGGNLRPTLPENVKTGAVIETIDLPDNMQVRILKASDGFSVQMYDKDSDNVVDGSVTMFKESVFEDNAFDSAKEYADNLAKEVRQEAKEAGEAAPEAKKEPSAGPTIIEMQAEIDRLKAQGAKPTEYVRDTTQDKAKRDEKAKKKQSKIIQQASRSEIEYARFDDLNTDPIQATPEQLKNAKELASSVNGELVFFDKNLNLGLVVVPDPSFVGFESYYPIHGGKISKVDVSDYTGLSVQDKSFLSRISRSIKVLRETSGKMLKGTEEQQKGVKSVAQELGGTPVYFNPDTNIGLVRGYGLLSGQPIYIPTIGNRYGRADIEVTTVPEFIPFKAELIAIKKQAELEAEKKHKEDPFIKFENGIAMSSGIDDSTRGVITEWKSMLNLGNVNVYFSTIEDATENRSKFTGPHRVVGSGTLDPNESGSTRRMSDGSYYVLFKKTTSKSEMFEVIAHELGHIHEKEAYVNASPELKNKLKQAHAKWLQQRKGKTAREAVDMLRAKTSAQTTGVPSTKKMAEDLSPYWSSFSEWYADQVSRWAVSDEKPVGVVEKFFARLGRALRIFYQTLKGRKFLPDETFVQYLKQINPVIVETIPGPIKEPVQIEMDFKMQKDLFGDDAKPLSDMAKVVGKKLPPGRSPELAAAAQAVQAGTMTAEQYDKLVSVYKPVQVYAEPMQPATSEQVFDALDVKKREQINPPIANGTRVGLRLDIPAFNRKGVFVVSIHEKRTKSAPGKVIGYGSAAKITDVTFGVGNQAKALEIAAGGAKDALQTIEGAYVNVTPAQAYAEAQRAFKDPSFIQVGIDPTRHSYFYDRRTTLPVVSADEVIQIGNMILAKNPVFGSKEDFLFNIDSSPALNEKDLKKRVQKDYAEILDYYRSIRQKEVALQKRIRNYGSTIETQRLANNLNEISRTLREDLDALKPEPVYSAENFLRQARAAMDGVTPYKEQAISPEVFAAIQAVYMDDPRILEGLRLSIKPGEDGKAGSFNAFARVVQLYAGTKGVTDPTTIRHEITHSLEQMMTEPQRKVVIESYLSALQRAVKKNTNPASQEYFDKVMNFLANPSRASLDEAIKALPSYDLYQFINPSEYWAVNAEKLMAQRHGPPWIRFKKAVRKIFDKLKSIFGFDNQYVVHRVFDEIMSGSKNRMGTQSLASYMANADINVLDNIKDDEELVRRYNRPDTPMLDHSPSKRVMLNAANFAKNLFSDMADSPSSAVGMMFNSLNRGVMYLRNKFIWFGSGINEADRIRYNGQVKTAEGLATASMALDNMIRGGNIASQVVFLGGIEFNKNTLAYNAVRRDNGMEKVYLAEAEIKKRLGEQLGTNLIQGYLEAKRSRSIINEFEYRKEYLEILDEQINEAALESQAIDADPNSTAAQKKNAARKLRSLFRQYKDGQEELKVIQKIREDKVTMGEVEIDEFISRDEVHPELKEIMTNFNAVNQNLLSFWRDVGLLSEERYQKLSNIKDYVPWYRIMDDEADIHSPIQATTKSATNIGKEKLFRSGKPSVVNDFIIEENQNLFKIQPGRVNAVKLNGIKVPADKYTVTPSGEVTLQVDTRPGDVLVIETQREIENMIDNMTRNVMRMTMNGLRQYAANRIVSEYATRGADGKIMTFPKADKDRGRFDYIANGRRVAVEIKDPLIAEAAMGMDAVGMKMWEPLAAAANFTRRTITASPVFQLKQVFKDAPTAALVTGVRNPAALIGGVYKSFVDSVLDTDPAATILRNAGIGGFYSPARTPEAEVKRRIGIINNNTFDYVMQALDKWGDSSDMAQRIATYNRVMKETGDEALAMYQSANVINFLRHGSGQLAQALVKTVPFLNAYAQSIDVLYNALVGGGLRGKDRTAALAQLALTGGLLAGVTILYTWLVGDDDEYLKLDDQSKVRNIMIPGTEVVLPMNTSAGFFFKAIPELITNKVINEGTDNEVDAKRLRTALKEAAIDMLMGPTPVPSAVKPFIEIGLNRNFFTSREVTPKSMEDLDAYQQYDMRTSEAAKLLSGLTGTKESRLLNPMETDHLVRSIFGTAGAMVAWASNLIGENSGARPEMTLKDMPITGAFLRPEVPRGREDLFYKLKESTDRKYATFNRLVERDQLSEAEAYLEKYPNLIAYHDYTSDMASDLKEINAAIRYIGETKNPDYTPAEKRKDIQELLKAKQDILEGVEIFRKEAYSD